MHTVVLEFPASLDFVRMARLVSSSLGAQLSFTVDEIDDLCIAVDELCSMLIGASIDSACALTIRFRLDANRLQLEASVPACTPGLQLAMSELSALIVHAAVDDHDFWRDADRVVGRITKQSATRA